MTGPGGIGGATAQRSGEAAAPVAAASLAVRRSAQAARRQGTAARRQRAVLREIDAVLDTLETWHLDPRSPEEDLPTAFSAVLGALSRVAEGPLPDSVREAPSSYQLHLALLAWQSDLLDILLPDRRARFPDLDTDGDEPLQPAPRSVRRRAAAQAAGLAPRPSSHR